MLKVLEVDGKIDPFVKEIIGDFRLDEEKEKELIPKIEASLKDMEAIASILEGGAAPKVIILFFFFVLLFFFLLFFSFPCFFAFFVLFFVFLFSCFFVSSFSFLSFSITPSLFFLFSFLI